MKKPLLLLTFASLFLLSYPSEAATPQKSPRPPKAQAATPKAPPVITGFTFRGFKIGDPAESLIQAFNMSQNCRGNFERDALTECTDRSPGIPGSSNVFIIYNFFNKKFYGFKMHFPLFIYSDIESMLIGKYGQPHKRLMEKAQTYSGQEIDRAVTVWNTTNGPLILRESYPRRDDSMLEFEDEASKKQIDANREQKMQETGKSLF